MSGNCKCLSQEEESDQPGLLVCTQCGKVAPGYSQGILRHDNSQTLGQSNPDASFIDCNRPPKSILSEKSKRGNSFGQILSKSRRECLLTLERITSFMKFTPAMKQQARNYVFEAIQSDQFRFKKAKIKDILTGVCVYRTMVDNKGGDIVTDICRVIPCERKEFVKVYFQYQKKFPHNRQIQEEASSTESSMMVKGTEEMVLTVLRSLRMESQVDKQSLINKTIDILSLVNDLHGMSGKSPVHVIIAAAFISWKSMDCKKRKNKSFRDFCKTHPGFAFKDIIPLRQKTSCFNNTVSQRIKEIQADLVGLSKKLPWLIHTKIDTKDVVFHLDDIMKYRRTLSDELKMDRETEEDARRLLVESKPPVTCNITGYEDIDDDEIDSYIRNEEEIQTLIECQTQMHENKLA